MKLGIISDTDIRTIDKMPAAITKALTDVDLIVHAGDFTHKDVLGGLRAIGTVKAVCGNRLDGASFLLLDPSQARNSFSLLTIDGEIKVHIPKV